MKGGLSGYAAIVGISFVLVIPVGNLGDHMKKVAIVAIVALICLGMVAQADAQPTFRMGIGVILDGTQPGDGFVLDLPKSDKPYGFSVSADYYTKSGLTHAFVRGVALYQSPEGGSLNHYLGAGTGISYKKESVAGIPVSNTKALATGVAGLNFRASESMGIYAEIGFDRALTSGVTNLFSIRVGVSFGGGE